ncbi:hypothetical protein Tco_1054638, partial [Tanacetum coccineum]
MDDEPMWAADRVVALTPGFAITISKSANEFAIKETAMVTTCPKDDKLECTSLTVLLVAPVDDKLAMKATAALG